MKKIVKMIIIMVLFIIAIRVAIRIFGKGHVVEYKVKNEMANFEIREHLVRNTKNENNGYNIKIKIKKTDFYYQIVDDFKNSKKIVKEIKYYKDNKYECLLPIFKHKKVLTDIVCKESDNYYNYTDIVGESKKLDKFVNDISEYNYDRFKDKLDRKKLEENISIYKNVEKIEEKIILEGYKGIYILDKDKISNIKILKKDVYTKHINELNDKYYLIADYNNKYEFNKFYIIDVTTGNKSTVISNEDISLNSYVQGSYGDNIYLFDKSNQIQYEINVRDKKVKKVKNIDKEIKIYNVDKWTKTDIYKATKEQVKFNYYKQNDNEKYFKIDKIGGDKTGYYYYYSKKGNKYNVYRSGIISEKQKTYLFTTNDIERIIYKEDKIYYISDNYLKVYSDIMGTKTILKYNELRFNDNLGFYIY